MFGSGAYTFWNNGSRNHISLKSVSYHTISCPVIMTRKKTPLYEMPLTSVFGFGFWAEHFQYRGFRCWRFVVGVLSQDQIDIKLLI